MSDATVVDLGSLIQRVQRSADPDARELAQRMAEAIQQPDRRVGAAFALKRRGGRASSLAERIRERDDAIYELTELQPGKTRNARIRAARSKQARYAAAGWPHERDRPEDTGNRERDLMRKIMRTGLPVPGERQHRGIVQKWSGKKLAIHSPV